MYLTFAATLNTTSGTHLRTYRCSCGFRPPEDHAERGVTSLYRNVFLSSLSIAENTVSLATQMRLHRRPRARSRTALGARRGSIATQRPARGATSRRRGRKGLALMGAKRVSSEIAVRLLGPLEVELSGRRVRFEGVKQRKLFMVLALHAPDAVSADELVTVLWGDEPPRGAAQALQKQISRLRQRLGDDSPVKYRPAGYSLEIDPRTIDARRFEDLLEEARVALGREDPEGAAANLRAGLALWRGEALADHRFDEFAQREIARLEELRVEAIEERIAAELACGREADVVGELQASVAEHPLRERLRGQLMVALYRAGRQAEALEVMRAGRRLMVDELGIEPGPELRQLERMILAQDPKLSAERHVTALAAPLPAVPNQTIGRGGELAEIVELLVDPEVRLVTLAGAGGVGKTRLALEAGRVVADRFPGGVAYVNLEGVEDAGVLVHEASSALGVVAATAAELGEQLGQATRGAPALLVLDGFERFLDDAEHVAQLLAAVANLTVLATSRAALRLSAEQVYHVQPLAAPNAAALFIARAKAARADGEIDDDRATVDAVCARLDGLPLAIELAADRARLLPLPALLERLEHRLELLTGGPRDLPLRQRSLRATLEWSWEALEDLERVLLGRLTVFEGGASLEAAEAVCAADGQLLPGVEGLLMSLLDKTSLLRTDAGHDAQPRFGMLDTVREFAAERAREREDVAALEDRHARYFLDYCEHAAEQAARTDRREWLDRLAQERGNIRLAIERLLRMGATDEALRIAIAFARALPWDAHAHEVRGWLAQTLDSPSPPPAARRATGLYWDGTLAMSQGLFDEARAQLEDATGLAREAPDQIAEAAALAALGRCAVLVDAPDAAERCHAAVAAAQQVGDPILIADALLTEAGACERAAAWERADELAGHALALYREAGDPYGAATALAEQGWYAMVHGRLDDSEERLGEALELRRRHGDDRRLVEPLIDHAWLMLARNESERARYGFLDCLALARHLGDQFNIAEALAGLSSLAAAESRSEDAARLAGASAALHDRIRAPAWQSVTAIHGRALVGARAALGDEGYAAHFAEGRRQSAEDAVAALQDEPERGVARIAP
jgi:predicted ATPase/DNA-binding SARP family transcriptional activator